MSSMESMTSDEPTKNNEKEPLKNLFEEILKLNPRSIRHQKMTKAMTRTVEGLLHNLRFPLFKNFYPELSKEYSDHLKEIPGQLRLQLKEDFIKEQEELCSENNVSPSITAVENLLEDHEGSQDKEAWRPSGNPSEDLRDHLHQMKLRHKKCLEFTLQTLTLRNESIERTIEEKHQDIMSIKGNIDQISQEIENHFASINDGNMTQLEEQISSILET